MSLPRSLSTPPPCPVNQPKSDIRELSPEQPSEILSLVEEAAAEAKLKSVQKKGPPAPPRQSWAASLAPRLSDSPGARRSAEKARQQKSVAARKEVLRTAFQVESDAEEFLAQARKEKWSANEMVRVARVHAKELGVAAKRAELLAEKARVLAEQELLAAKNALRAAELAEAEVWNADDKFAGASIWEREAALVAKEARRERAQAQAALLRHEKKRQGRSR